MSTPSSQLRVRALQFAARLRGAEDEADVVEWAIQAGYLVMKDGIAELTEAGIKRTDDIIKADPKLWRE